MRFHLLVEMLEGGRGRGPVATLRGFFSDNEQIITMPVMAGQNLRRKAHGGVLTEYDALILTATSAVGPHYHQISMTVAGGKRLRENDQSRVNSMDSCGESLKTRSGG
jgi:hypothetical protein